MDANGDLFGTTFNSSTDSGTVYTLAKGSSTITTLASFTNATVNPDLAVDPRGDVFGSIVDTLPGNDTVYEIQHGTSTVIPLVTFAPTDDVMRPCRGFAGNLYGVTSAGGADSDGAIFEIA